MYSVINITYVYHLFKI